MLSEVCHQDRAIPILRRVLDGTLVAPLLLIGPEGVGRRFSVLCLMRELLCTGTRKADCSCASCYQIPRGLHPDIQVHDSTTERMGVQAMRDMLEAARVAPSAGDILCVVLDGVDRFASGEAADVLLKTLEEPPPRTRFFLLAQHRAAVSDTIRSRCVEVRYGQLKESFIADAVKARVPDDSRVLVYSRMGEGSVGKALMYATAGKLRVRDTAIRCLQAVSVKDLPGLFSIIDTLKDDIDLAVHILLQLLHDMTIAETAPDRVVHCDVTDALLALRSSLALDVRESLFVELERLQSALAWTKLVAHFQLKTVFAASAY